MQSHACVVIHAHFFSDYHAFDIFFYNCNMLLVQKEEWKLHQLECRAMAALTENRKKMLTPTIRLMVRLALKRKLQNEKVLSALFLPLFSLPRLKLYVVSHVVISFHSFLENESVY